MIVGSVCSGIGGIDRGLEACGLSVAYQCEADPFRRSVLRERYPHVPCYPDLHSLPALPVDVLAGGSPCQDFAAHGSRQGLDGERSGLWWAFLRAIER
jgi:DNA (cytosine-5)-methyltransferase 1